MGDFLQEKSLSLRVFYKFEHEPLPKQGDYSVILDSRGDARCVIKTTRVCVVPFDKVSEAHAYKEGEGDRTLAFWRETHRDFSPAVLEKQDCLSAEQWMLFVRNLK